MQHLSRYFGNLLGVIHPRLSQECSSLFFLILFLPVFPSLTVRPDQVDTVFFKQFNYLSVNMLASVNLRNQEDTSRTTFILPEINNFSTWVKCCDNFMYVSGDLWKLKSDSEGSRQRRKIQGVWLIVLQQEVHKFYLFAFTAWGNWAS